MVLSTYSVIDNSLYFVSHSQNAVTIHSHYVVPLFMLSIEAIFSRFDLNIKSSPPGQNDRHFADDIFIGILVNKKFVFFY